MNTEPKANRLSELHGIKAEFGIRTTVYFINICSPVHSLGISCSFHLSTAFSFPLYDLITNRYQHDRDLLYKEPFSLSDMLLHWPELILTVDMVNTVCSILETLLETFWDWTQKRCFILKICGAIEASACGRMIICACQEFSAHVFATVYIYHRNKVLYCSLLSCPLWNENKYPHTISFISVSIHYCKRSK